VTSIPLSFRILATSPRQVPKFSADISDLTAKRRRHPTPAALHLGRNFNATGLSDTAYDLTVGMYQVGNSITLIQADARVSSDIEYRIIVKLDPRRLRVIGVTMSS
jgi:hypothetical protein